MLGRMSQAGRQALEARLAAARADSDALASETAVFQARRLQERQRFCNFFEEHFHPTRNGTVQYSRERLISIDLLLPTFTQLLQTVSGVPVSLAVLHQAFDVDVYGREDRVARAEALNANKCRLLAMTINLGWVYRHVCQLIHRDIPADFRNLWGLVNVEVLNDNDDNDMALP